MYHNNCEKKYTNIKVSSDQLQNVMLSFPVNSLCIVSKQDHDFLQQSILSKTQRIAELEQINVNLNNTIDHLRNDNIQLQQTIERNDKEIYILKTENAKLKKQLKKLENDMKELQNKNNALERSVVQLMEKNLTDKMKVAIQDVNAMYQLEQSFPPKHKKQLFKLRLGRNEDFHYIINDENYGDPPELIDYKMQKIKEQLKNVSSSTRADLGKELCQELITYLDKLPPNPTNPSDEDLEEADKWWLK